MKGLNYKLSSIFLMLVLFGCKQKEEIRNVKAKIIEYNVNYIDQKAGSVPTSILPGKMNLYFAGDYAMNEIEGFLGQFSLTYIANRKKKTVITLLKIFDKKYFYKGAPGELPAGINPMHDMRITEVDSTKKIAGFLCKGWRISTSKDDSYYIFGTDEIKVKSPNITTPFLDRDEVLLEFYTELSVLKMKLTAESYRQDTISNAVFYIPDNFVEISKLKMNNTIDELFK